MASSSTCRTLAWLTLSSQFYSCRGLCRRGPAQHSTASRLPAFHLLVMFSGGTDLLDVELGVVPERSVTKHAMGRSKSLSTKDAKKVQSLCEAPAIDLVQSLHPARFWFQSTSSFFARRQAIDLAAANTGTSVCVVALANSIKRYCAFRNDWVFGAGSKFVTKCCVNLPVLHNTTICNTISFLFVTRRIPDVATGPCFCPKATTSRCCHVEEVADECTLS